MITHRSERPVRDQWFVSDVIDGLVRITEPGVHPALRSNIWWLRDRDRDVVVDSGLGVEPLRLGRPELFFHDPILVATHAHLDHIGGAAEFTTCLAHSSEVQAIQSPRASLYAPELAALLGDPVIARLASEPDGVLLDAFPRAAYDPGSYSLRSAEALSLNDGDTVTGGLRRLEVLHLPGHSPGSIALYEATSGSLFSGDVIYSGQLLDTLEGGDPVAYRSSLARLLDLDVQRVYPGHGEPFGHEVMTQIIDDYLRLPQYNRFDDSPSRP